MKTIRKLKWMLVVVLLGWANVSNAHVYWKPNSGNDSNDGSTAAKAVKSWTRAKALLANQNNDQWIYLTEQLTISSTTTMDGAISGKANARVKRNTTSGFMFTVNSGCTFTLKNIRISGELASATPHPDGVRSIIATSGAVVLDNGAILEDNWVRDVSEPFAGAIRLYNNSTLTMKTGSTIQRCQAYKAGSTVFEGGAIMSGANCTMNIEGGTIKDCFSKDLGGAICLRSGTYTLNITGGTIENCYSPKGGAVFVAPCNETANVKATITMSGGTIKNCNNASILSGGAFYVGSRGTNNSITLNLSGGTIDNCDAAGTTSIYGGGGVFCCLGVLNLNLSGTTIKNCDAQKCGGGIFVGGITENGSVTQVKATINISGGLIENCSANSLRSSTYGGGIFMHANVAGSTLTMTGGKIHHCTAHTHGGGLEVRGENTVTHLTKGEIYECICAGDAIGDGIGRGGGAAFHSSTIAYIDGDEMLIHDNVCKHYGGGVQVDGGATLYFSAGKVYNNTAGYVEPEKVSCGAAGLHITAATLHMSGGDLYGNETLGVGGGIHASYEGVMEITGGNIYDNIAEQQGGGINLNTQCDLRVPQGSTLKIYDNEAGIGGAILLDGANLYIHDGEYYGNQALDTYPTNIFESGAGGAFCLIMDRGDVHHGDSVFPANFYMYGGNVHDNLASRDGGALFVSKNTEHPMAGVSHITIKGGDMHDNEAETGSGGGIYADAGCIFYMGDTLNAYGYIQNNTAKISGGGVYLTDAKFTIEAGAFLNNTAEQDGGGFYIAGDTAQVIIKGGEIKYNLAQQNGGGFAVVGGTVDISQANTTHPTLITNNNASNNGGGFYVNAGSATSVTTIKGGATVANNTALNGGGAFINQGRLVIQDAATNLTSNTASTSGGGIYMANGTVTFTNAKLQNNTATNNDGGGLYVGDGTITVSGASATISGNQAGQWGGGVYVGGTITVDVGTIKQNQAQYRGGGIFVADGTFTLNGGTVGGTATDGNYTTATGNALYGGGGLFVLGGTANINGGAISGNHVGDGTAGGGIYMGQNNTVNPPTSGTCYVYGGTIGGASSSYANSATYGGGIYSEGGTIHVTQSSKNRTSGNIAYNEADYGGGIYTNGSSGVVYVDHGDIQYNTATDGGGIYANRGLVDFSNGNIVYNNATNEGGGIYVNMNTDNTYGTLNLKGTAVLNRNHVPDGHKGGGVYLKGVVVIGEEGGALCSVTADDNFAHTLTGSETVLAYTPDNTTRNNIYLPNPEVRADHTGLITVVENTIGTNSHIGFSVPRNHLPVIYCAPSATSMSYLDRFTTGAGHDLNTRLFDDTQHYLSVHYPDWPEAFDRDHVYLYGFWPEAVTSLPAGYTVDGDGNVTISTKEGLAWLISTVNGYNGVTASDFYGKTVDLVADVDMSAYGWVPVGFMGNAQSTPEPFNGTFNGNGHTITGIDCMVYGSGVNGFIDYGLFGFVESGTVENVLLKDAKFYLDSNPDLVLGALVGELSGGTLCNSEASATLVSRTPDATIGGAVGKQTDGTVHSVIGIGEMTGGTMGGLVGVLEANGDLYNSFANPMFHRLGTATTQYYGVLAAVNKGTIENCYSRLQNDPVPSDAYFGWFVGDNNVAAKLKYCYTRGAGGTPYFANNNSPAASTTGYGYYADNTEAPYLYARRDNQVTIVTGSNPYEPKYRSGDKQMLFWLNNWVEKNGATTYTKWMRTTSKTINNDLPVLKMPFANSIVGTTTTVYLDYGDINTMMAEYRAVNQALCLYKSKAGMNSNTGSGAKLYINEDVSVIPADRENGVINAYVGITIANIAGADGANPTFGGSDAIDWHMFSTPLQAAPLGIDYHSDLTSYHGSMSNYNYYSHAGMPYYRFMEGDLDGNIGYFPDRRYGESYPLSDATVVNGNYYAEWDFYTYYEPEYHWINFKRNSQDHWHENAHDVQIHYFGDGVNEGNETNLVQGRGYLVAFADSATYLQCHGALNKGASFSIPVTSRGYYSTGYNLLGNPYQACLDFNAFAEYNSSDEDDEAIWLRVEDASYRILSETAKDYVTYAYGSSANPFGAGRYIHPHQGFMVFDPAHASAVAYFQDIDGDDPVHMRAIEDATPYRGVQVDYPLVNLFATEGNGNETMVTVELGRPDKGGAKLMSDLRVGKGQMWCHYDDADWKLAFTRPGVSELPIRFSTVEDTEYTMTWSTHNGEFSYLHLIDNMTGADIDCLAESEYKFSSKTSDYKSRFRLVFGYTGIEENDEAESEESEFAFMMGDELVVNGEGTLEMFDVNGRRLMSTRTQGTQTTLHLPQVSTGVYVLRMTGDGQVKTQKMVINQ